MHLDLISVLDFDNLHTPMAITFKNFDALTSIVLLLTTVLVALAVHYKFVLRLLWRSPRKLSEEEILLQLRSLHRQLCESRGLPLNPHITRISGCPEFSMLLENATIDQYGSLIFTYEPWENTLPPALKEFAP